jgi:hypothetical protein
MAALPIHIFPFIHTCILLPILEPQLLPPPNASTSIQTQQQFLPDTGYLERLLPCGYSTCLLYCLIPSSNLHPLPHDRLVQF